MKVCVPWGLMQFHELNQMLSLRLAVSISLIFELK